MTECYEIRIYTRDGSADSTSSGPLRVSEAEAVRLFEADAATVDPGLVVELTDYDTDEVLRSRAA